MVNIPKEECKFVSPEEFGLPQQMSNAQLVKMAKAINGMTERLSKEELKQKIAELTNKLNETQG